MTEQKQIGTGAAPENSPCREVYSFGEYSAVRCTEGSGHSGDHKYRRGSYVIVVWKDGAWDAMSNRAVNP